MARPRDPAQSVLTRRTTLTRLGAGGLALGLSAHPLLTRAQATPPTALPAFLEAWQAGWNSADPARIASAYAADATVEVVPFHLTLPGPQAIRQYFVAYFGAFRHPLPHITLLFATADHAAAEWTFQGQYTGQLPPLPKGAGQAVTLRGANVMTLRGGQIVTEHIYTDLATILGQLGLLPSAAGTPTAATPVS